MYTCDVLSPLSENVKTSIAINTIRCSVSREAYFFLLFFFLFAFCVHTYTYSTVSKASNVIANATHVRRCQPSVAYLYIIQPNAVGTSSSRGVYTRRSGRVIGGGGENTRKKPTIKFYPMNFGAFEL